MMITIRKIANKIILLAICCFFILVTFLVAFASNDAFQVDEYEFDYEWGSPNEYRMNFGMTGLATSIFAQKRTVEDYLENDIKPRFVKETKYIDWDKVKINVDWDARKVTAIFEDPEMQGTRKREYVYVGSQGSVILPYGVDKVFFKPMKVIPNLPDPNTQPWPTGDVLTGKIPQNVNKEAIDSILDRIFKNDIGERSWTIVHKGEIIAERFREGFSHDTPMLSKSQGKIFYTMALGILVGDGYLDPEAPAPIPEWHKYPGDPRAKITIRHLMDLSSGLGFVTMPRGPDIHYSPANHHLSIYIEGIDASKWSTSRLLVDDSPGTVYRYRNCDPMILGRVIRDIVDKHYDIDYLEFLQRTVFDKIGVRNTVFQTDPYGNFLWPGSDWVSNRDWARIGLLYLQGGKWQGEQVLPEGWVDYVLKEPASTKIRAGFWMINLPHLPKGSYGNNGAYHNRTIVIPSEDMVVAVNGWMSPKSYNDTLVEIAEIISAGIAKEVAIDIKKSDDIITVLMPTTKDFDVADIALKSVRLGKAKPVYHILTDEGHWLLHFHVQETGIQPDDTWATLTGKYNTDLFTNRSFFGSAKIVTVP